MAKLRVNAEFAAERLFGCSENPVRITNARFDPFAETIELLIEGPDVPEVAEVTATFTVTQNRAGERIHSLKFEAVKG